VGKPPPGTEGGDYVLQKPPAEERSAIDAAIDNALGVMPQVFSGDLQGAMNKLHSQDKAVEAKKVEAPKKEKPKEKQMESPAAKPEAAKPGFLKSLFGKK
jgi:hypothetical protein